MGADMVINPAVPALLIRRAARRRPLDLWSSAHKGIGQGAGQRASDEGSGPRPRDAFWKRPNRKRKNDAQDPSHRHGARPRARLGGGARPRPTLDDVKARGTLKCGANAGLAGFAAPDASGVWEGFDVDICYALAAAIFGDPTKVEFTPTTGETRFTALASGEIDVLVAQLDLDLHPRRRPQARFRRGQLLRRPGLHRRRRTSASPRRWSSTARRSASRPAPRPSSTSPTSSRSNNMSYQPVPIQTEAEARQQFLAGACDAYTTDASGLAAVRATYENPGQLHHPARDHLEGAARAGRAPRRQPVGRHRALDLLRPGRGRGATA